MTGERAADGGRVFAERDGPVMTVTLSNPARRNALTWPMYDELAAICDTLNGDRATRVVVIRGSTSAFAAGTDIAQFRDFTSGADGVAYEHRVGAVLDRVLAIEHPVIAAVDGPAVGAGLAIAACCDLILASDDAVFGVPIARTIGNCIPAQVLARLQARMGVSRTMGMLLTAELLSAREAEAAGLAYRVVATGEFDDVLAGLVHRIAASAPLALRSLKEIDRRLAAATPVTDADDILAACYGSEDFHEGVEAFLSHRRPQWAGR